ncbi:MAG: FadR/GntR family transcriptional regulator [Thermodesulfobacteriota bacterium]
MVLWSKTLELTLDKWFWTMFQPAKQNKIFEDVVDQIQEAILSGQLRPGDTLPPERELKEMLRISRGTLREALRVLEQKGLIEIKLGTGGGPVVKDLSDDKMRETLALLIRHQKVSLEHLAEFRMGVEGEVAALAAQRATPQDIFELEDLLSRARLHAERGPGDSGKFLALDKEIHQRLAKISGNPIYFLIHTSIHGNIDRYYERFLDMREAALKANVRDLKLLIAAVADGDSEQARSVAAEHVKRFSARMRRAVRIS